MVLANKEILKTTPVGDIPSTSDFPNRWIYDFLPSGGMLLDVGSGGNPHKDLSLQALGITPWAIDINEGAVSALKSFGLFADVADATKVGSGEQFWTIPGQIEIFHAVLYQATMSSLLGNSWKTMLEGGDVMLHPDRYMFFTIYLNADRVYEDLIGLGYTRSEWEESARRWSQRYITNFRAFNEEEIQLPYHAFAVGKSGKEKEYFDWTDDVGFLRNMFALHSKPAFSQYFERFAQHTNMEEFENFMINGLGYVLERKRMVARPSRVSGVLSPGADYVWRKPENFRYRPWYAGLSTKDKKTQDIRKERETAAVPMDLNGYHERYSTRLLANLPASQKAAFSVWYKGEKIEGFGT